MLAAHNGLPTAGCGLPTVGCGLTTVVRGPWAGHRGHWAAHRGQVEDKMSGFLLQKGVRLLGKSDLVFSLNRCWANCIVV